MIRDGILKNCKYVLNKIDKIGDFSQHLSLSGVVKVLLYDVITFTLQPLLLGNYFITGFLVGDKEFICEITNLTLLFGKSCTKLL